MPFPHSPQREGGAHRSGHGIDGIGFGSSPAIIVHQGRAQRLSPGIDADEGAGGAIDGEGAQRLCCDALPVEVFHDLPRSLAQRRPPVRGHLLVKLANAKLRSTP